MKFILVRHLKPDMPMQTRYTAREFNDALIQYNQSGITTYTPTHTGSHNYTFYCSRTHSSIETVTALFGNQNICVTSLLDELPLTVNENTSGFYSFPTWQRKAFRQWKKSTDYSTETYSQTQKRASQVIEMLEKKGENAVLISHTFFLSILLQLFKRKKYEITKPHLLSILYGDRIRVEPKTQRCGGCKHNCALNKPACEIGRDKALINRIELASDTVNQKRF